MRAADMMLEPGTIPSTLRACHTHTAHAHAHGVGYRAIEPQGLIGAGAIELGAQGWWGAGGVIESQLG